MTSNGRWGFSSLGIGHSPFRKHRKSHTLCHYQRSLLPHLPLHALFILTMVLISVICLATAWYGVHYFLVTLQPIALQVAEDIGSNSTTYYLADQFFENLDNWLLVVGLISLGIWAYAYSMHKGARV